jgi:hypothetical protein
MDQRDPLEKETFMSGIRQKWAVVFLLCGMGVLFVNILVPGFDPVSYMQFLLAIGSLFILGASADSGMKVFAVKSIRETQVIEETKRMNVTVDDNSIPDNDVIFDFKTQYANDPSYAPLEWTEEQSTGEMFR